MSKTKQQSNKTKNTSNSQKPIGQVKNINTSTKGLFDYHKERKEDK
ncbi:hypothetical protein [Butyribacter intestini]